LIESFIGWIIHPISVVASKNISQRISLAALLAAAALATNYLMVGLVNVKLMDLIVFTSGYILGPKLGALTGILVWLVYGTLNPFGFSLPVFIATIMGETLFGVAGGFFAGRGKNHRVHAWAAVAGFLVTLFYDLFTNIISGLSAGVPVYIALLTGIPFMLTHVLSNTVFFIVGFKPLAKSINRIW